MGAKINYYWRIIYLWKKVCIFGLRLVSNMKPLFYPLLALAFVVFTAPAGAQTVKDAGYRTVAHIESDGTIKDAGYRTIGHIESNGTVKDAGYRTVGHITSTGKVQDEGYRTVGYIKDDGTVQDSGYRTIGHIRDDGTVQDAGYRTIGHAEGIPLHWAAFFFFFVKD